MERNRRSEDPRGKTCNLGPTGAGWWPGTASPSGLVLTVLAGGMVGSGPALAQPHAPEPWYRPNEFVRARLGMLARAGHARPLLSLPVFEDRNNNFGLADVGGRSVPRPADLDGDGDLDLLVGEEGGNLVYFENTGSAATPAFAGASTNPFGLTAVGALSAPAFADIDDDGDLDLFVGDDYGDTFYFENTGSSVAPAFAAAQFNPFGLANTGGFSSVPALADLDDDGDLDAILGEGYGFFNYFENTGTQTAPAFLERTGSDNPLDGLNTSTYSTPYFVDIDADGDLDLFSGWFLGEIIYYENQGTASVPVFGSGITDYVGLQDVGYWSAPALVDIDADGDLDAFVGEKLGFLRYFENTGSVDSPSFVIENPNPLVLADVGQRAAPVFVDLDDDGDLDALVGENGPSTGISSVAYFYENTGTSSVPAFGEALMNPFGLAGMGFEATPAFADLDGDGDADLLTGERSGRFFFFENTGTSLAPAFAARVINPFGCAPAGVSRTAPALVDIDADGDFDVFFGAEDGVVRFFENTGDALNPACGTQMDAPFGITGGPPYGKPAFVDVDLDGDADLFVGGSDGTVTFFENTGDAMSPAFVRRDGTDNPLAGVVVDGMAAPAFIDGEGDGDPDVFVGDAEGTLKYYHNTEEAALALILFPLDPPVIIPAEGGSFDWHVEVTNTTEMTLTRDLWVEITQEEQGVRVVRGPLGLSLAPGETLALSLTQQVPGDAPEGAYRYTVKVGTLRLAVESSATFGFSKAAGSIIPSVWGWGLDVALGTEEAGSAVMLPARPTLDQNYPNPFRQSTDLTFELPEGDHIRLAVYDVQGRQVGVLFEGWQAPGHHTVRWDAGTLPSGIYFYRLTGRRHTLVRSMLLVR